MNDYTHALLRHDPLGKAAGVMAGPSRDGGEEGATRQVAAPGGGGGGGEAMKVVAKAIEKRLPGVRGDRRRGPRRRAARADRTMTQIGFPALQASGRAGQSQTVSVR